MTLRTTGLFRGVVLLGAMGLGMGCGGSTPRGPESAGEAEPGVLAHNRQLGTRYFDEVWNRGKLDVLDELLAGNYVNHTPSTPNPPPGPNGLKPIVQAIRQGYPDLHFQIEDMVVTKDRVVMRTVMTGTNTGTLFGAAPTGRRIRVNQINIEEIRDGRITDHWRVTDELGIQQQLKGR